MKVFACVFMILGCFMGAGFVSGREVSAYFSKFGSCSVYSIILVTILLFVLILFFLLLSRKTDSFESFARLYFGRFHIIANWLLAFCVHVYTCMYAYIIHIGKWQPTPVFLPAKPHGQRSLAGYSPWGPRVGRD